MGDTITVKHSKLKVEGAAIVNRIEYDVIAEKNLAVDVGNVKAKFTDKVNKASDVVNKITEIQQTANQAITAANGKNTNYWGPDEPVGNFNEGDLWFRVVDGEYTRTYRYDGIQWQLIVSADVKDIEEIANDARNQADQAVANANLATSNALEAISEAQGAFDEAQSAITRADSAFNKADALSTKVDNQTGEISSIKQIAQGLQTRVSSAEGSISTLQQTSSSYATRIENAEGDISSLTQTTQGLQTAVSNKADKSTVTQLAGVVDTKITKGQADGWYASQSQFTQTAESLQSTITSVRNELGELEYENRNLITNSKGDNLEGWTTWSNTALSILDGTIRVRASTSPSSYGAVTPKFEVEAGKQYTLSLNIASNFRTNILDYVYLLFDAHSNQRVNSIVMTAQHADLRRYSITFTANSTGTASMLLGAYVKETDYLSEGFLLEKVKLERGTKSTPYSPSPIDTQSQISQLSNNINLRVLKDDVINQINVSTENILISGKKLILDGDTTVRGTFRVANANITSVNAGKITAGTFDAGRVSVINLSANSITGGILQSQNSNTTFNLNSGSLYMQNTNFTLGGGADIYFEDSGNRLYYSRYDSVGGITRSAGVGFGTSINNRFPYAFLGTTNTSKPHAMDSANFTGFITNTRQRQITDGIGNSVVGHIFHIRDEAVNFAKGLRFDLTGNRINIHPMSSGTYDYDIGTSNGSFERLYLGGTIYSNGRIEIRNKFDTNQGWAIKTGYDGSSRIEFVGLNAGGNWANPKYYDLGSTSNRFSNIFLFYQPDVSSDERLKENIHNNTLGLDFINDIVTKSFKLINNNPRLSKEPTQYGVIAQQLRDTLIKYGVDYEDTNMLTVGNDGMYGVQYTQLIAPTIKSVQELDLKVDTKVSRLRKQNEELILKVAKLEERIHHLEVA